MAIARPSMESQLKETMIVLQTLVRWIQNVRGFAIARIMGLDSCVVMKRIVETSLDYHAYRNTHSQQTYNIKT